MSPQVSPLLCCPLCAPPNLAEFILLHLLCYSVTNPRRSCPSSCTQLPVHGCGLQHAAADRLARSQTLGRGGGASASVAGTWLHGAPTPLRPGRRCGGGADGAAKAGGGGSWAQFRAAGGGARGGATKAGARPGSGAACRQGSLKERIRAQPWIPQAAQGGLPAVVVDWGCMLLGGSREWYR